LYWERVCHHRWPNVVFPEWKRNFSWKERALERAVAEYIESLDPKYVVYEDVRSYAKRVSPNLYRLNIRSLKAPEIDEDELAFQRATGEEPALVETEQLKCYDWHTTVVEETHLNPVIHNERINLSVPLQGFKRLEELTLSFGMSNTEEKKVYRPAEINLYDMLNTAKGIRSCKFLIKLTIVFTLLTPELLEILLQYLVFCKALRILELNMCFLKNEGMKKIQYYLEKCTELRELRLRNNEIGEKGMLRLLKVLNSTGLEKIDLSMNPLGDDAGILTAMTLQQNITLRNVVLSGCLFGDLAGATFGDLLSINNTILQLDLSCNNFENYTEDAILSGLSKNRTIEEVNVRGCGISSDVLSKIRESAWANKEGKRLNITKEGSPLDYVSMDDESYDSFDAVPSTESQLTSSTDTVTTLSYQDNDSVPILYEKNDKFYYKEGHNTYTFKDRNYSDVMLVSRDVGKSPKTYRHGGIGEDEDQISDVDESNIVPPDVVTQVEITSD
jgi:hypothetical protein